MAAPKTNTGYAAKLKALRPYVEFNYDLRRPLHSSQKAKINRYFETYSQVARRKKVFRSRNPEHVKKVQQFAGNEFDNLPQFKVAFYTSTEANPQRIRFRDGKLKVTGEHFRMTFVPIDPEYLASDPDSAVADAIAEEPNAKWYRIAAGEWAIETPYPKTTIADHIKQHMALYDTYKPDGSKANNNYRNWLRGIIPLYAANQRELLEVRVSEFEERAKLAKSPRKRRQLERQAKSMRAAFERFKQGKM